MRIRSHGPSAPPEVQAVGIIDIAFGSIAKKVIDIEKIRYF